MRFYRRRLPHIDAPGVPVFVTWRLAGSLPPERVFPRNEPFAVLDRLLNEARSGPTYLRQPWIAELVRDAIEIHRPHAWVIMPNHVHVLWTPADSLAALIGKVKGSTARAANSILGTTGEPFWQDDYFDRLVRDGTFEGIRRYIEWNPVKAGLATRPEDFPWSSSYGGRASARAAL